MKVRDGHNGYENYDTMIARDWLDDSQSKEFSTSNDMKTVSYTHLTLPTKA